MGTRTPMAADLYGGNVDAGLSNLLDFCVDSFTICFSHDADKLCVPVGLSAASALLLLLSCFPLAYQTCRCRAENPGATIIFFYRFVGNTCATFGAVLSRQLHIQILVGAFATSVDAVNVMSCCLPVLLCWNSNAERRRRMMRKRRRQHLLAVCVLMIIAGGFLKSRVTHYPTDGPLIRRRLLRVFLQDNTEILGYVLGLISFVIACTSRFPALCQPYRQQLFTWAYILSGLLSSVAWLLYAAAMLLYDTRIDFLLRVMPWLLSAVGCVTLDLLILVIHWYKWMRGTRRRPVRFCPDTECLLRDPGIPAVEKTGVKRDTKEQMHSSAKTKNKLVQNVTEMGGYMDVSSCPARKICPKEEMLSKKGVGWFPDRTVRIIGVNSYSSSDTSYNSSPVSSDLEWDFEDANAQWRKSTAKNLDGNLFPLMEWQKNTQTP